MKQNTIKFYQNTLRILLILYFFSDPFEDKSEQDIVRLFTNEVRLQKINFLIRYPSYLCYELMLYLEKHPEKSLVIESIIQKIFQDNEPELRTEEMERFLYGAWEDLNDVILFLKTYKFIKYDSNRRVNLTKYQKKYYLTKHAVTKVQQGLKELPNLKWYFDRCGLIQEYFGDLSGRELAIRQYQHPEYSATALGEKIADIEQKTKQLYLQKFGTTL